jgi:multiple sugar transport system ATP-binding protein
MAGAAVDLKGIVKRFGTTEVLRGVDLEIEPGSFVSIVGPSGCGKSTLLRIIAGLERQTGGDVSIDGDVVNHLPPKDRNIAMVFQSYALYPHMTVFQNIALPLIMRRMSAAQRLPFVGRYMPSSKALLDDISRLSKETARLLQLSDLLSRKPRELSGGQRQRVALGRALVRDPVAFLMDEPLSNLDAKLRVEMRSEITHLHRRLKATVIYVTHDQAEAMTMSDVVALMMRGNLLQVGTPVELYEDPDNLDVAEFIGSPKINVLPGSVRTGGVTDVLGISLPIPSGLRNGSTVFLGMRPETLSLGPQCETGSLSGKVANLEYLGSDLFTHVSVADTYDPVTIRVDPRQAGQLKIGDVVSIHVQPENVYVFDENKSRVRATSSVAAVI